MLSELLNAFASPSLAAWLQNEPEEAAVVAPVDEPAPAFQLVAPQISRPLSLSEQLAAKSSGLKRAVNRQIKSSQDAAAAATAHEAPHSRSDSAASTAVSDPFAESAPPSNLKSPRQIRSDPFAESAPPSNLKSPRQIRSASDGSRGSIASRVADVAFASSAASQTASALSLASDSAPAAAAAAKPRRGSLQHFGTNLTQLLKSKTAFLDSSARSQRAFHEAEGTMPLMSSAPAATAARFDSEEQIKEQKISNEAQY